MLSARVAPVRAVIVPAKCFRSCTRTFSRPMVFSAARHDDGVLFTLLDGVDAAAAFMIDLPCDGDDRGVVADVGALQADQFTEP